MGTQIRQMYEEKISIFQYFNNSLKPLKSNFYLPRHLQTYGTPEELSINGGPPFAISLFTHFLKDWTVMHRLSSAAYPQSNDRAELAVKTAKRIIIDNTGAQGFLDNDRVAIAVLQYRNTPVQNIGLSLAQQLLHRRLRDFMPSQPTLYKLHAKWITAARNPEKTCLGATPSS